jgi:hypothetical protein
MVSGPLKSFDDEAAWKTTSPRFAAPDSSLSDVLEWPKSSRRILIRGGDVITMLNADVLRDHDVYLEGETICRIAPTGTIDRTGVEVIDANGKFIMPGLSDLHTHPTTALSLEMFSETTPVAQPHRFALPYQLLLFQYLSAGITRVQTMYGDPDLLGIRDRVASGEYVGPTIRVATPLVDGPAPLMPPRISWLVADEAGGLEVARRAKSGGYDLIKPYSNLPLPAYKGLMAEARKLGVHVCGHVPFAASTELAISEGQHIAHAREYVFSGSSTLPDCDPSRLQRLATASAAAGIFVQTTLAVFERSEDMVRGRNENFYNADNTAYTNPFTRQVMAPDSPMMEAWATTEETRELFGTMGTFCKTIISSLHSAGVSLVSGSDAPGTMLAEGFSIHQELERLVDGCGLTPHQALETSTVNAARYHGEAGNAGVVAEGARADLLLLDENPLDDIRATRSINTVIVRGAALRRPVLDEGQRRIRTAIAAMSV